MPAVLITGAGGFIGSHSVHEFVQRDCHVYALVHKNIPDDIKLLEKQQKITILQADICNKNQLVELVSTLPQLDAIVHCAAKASDVGRHKDFFSTNYLAVQYLVTAAIKNNTKRFVFVSSTDVYGMHDFNGETEKELSLDDSATNPYPYYKIQAERWIQHQLPSHRYCFIRPAAVWGENDPTLTKRVKDFLRWSPWIVHFGPWKGKNRWPLAHVQNVALANYIGAFHPQSAGEAINVIDSEWTTMDKFYCTIAQTYFPQKKFTSLYLPTWLGKLIGTLSTSLSNILNTKHPVWDPTYYAMLSISKNLDFSGKKFEFLKQNYVKHKKRD